VIRGRKAAGDQGLGHQAGVVGGAVQIGVEDEVVGHADEDGTDFGLGGRGQEEREIASEKRPVRMMAADYPARAGSAAVRVKGSNKWARAGDGICHPVGGTMLLRKFGVPARSVSSAA
jgi:hypothetical protein